MKATINVLTMGGRMASTEIEVEKYTVEQWSTGIPEVVNVEEGIVFELADNLREQLSLNQYPHPHKTFIQMSSKMNEPDFTGHLDDEDFR